MQRNSASIFMVFAAIVLTTLFVIVTSAASSAHSAASASAAAPQLQQITATPTESDDSVAGSTDGIVSMGIGIALIVLLPMLASRLMWARQPK